MRKRCAKTACERAAHFWWGVRGKSYSSENYSGLNSIKNSINQELLCACVATAAAATTMAAATSGRPDDENIAYAFKRRLVGRPSFELLSGEEKDFFAQIIMT